jgi:hypothetical protein
MHLGTMLKEQPGDRDTIFGGLNSRSARSDFQTMWCPSNLTLPSVADRHGPAGRALTPNPAHSGWSALAELNHPTDVLSGFAEI